MFLACRYPSKSGQLSHSNANVDKAIVKQLGNQLKDYVDHDSRPKPQTYDHHPKQHPYQRNSTDSFSDERLLGETASYYHSTDYQTPANRQPVIIARPIKCHNYQISNSFNGERLSRTPSSPNSSEHSPTSSNTKGSTTNKFRRGRVEKKRRDRINGCLAELKRLIPGAFDKQGAHKMEKADILQMAVTHLRTVAERQTNAIHAQNEYEYQSMGFRACASAVAHFLDTRKIGEKTSKGLMDYLQCHSAQQKSIWQQSIKINDQTVIKSIDISQSMFSTEQSETTLSSLHDSGEIMNPIIA